MATISKDHYVGAEKVVYTIYEVNQATDGIFLRLNCTAIIK